MPASITCQPAGQICDRSAVHPPHSCSNEWHNSTEEAATKHKLCLSSRAVRWHLLQDTGCGQRANHRSCPQEKWIVVFFTCCKHTEQENSKSSDFQQAGTKSILSWSQWNCVPTWSDTQLHLQSHCPSADCSALQWMKNTVILSYKLARLMPWILLLMIQNIPSALIIFFPLYISAALNHTSPICLVGWPNKQIAHLPASYLCSSSQGPTHLCHTLHVI